ncbi:hypothetical protein PV726_10365 [Streptomyces europaeiscabiei]|uniref:hypothetical protein n=1 Tax=Streptomyces europaeiscabiei TaxID=146819 RepID=UPI0029AF92BB|nr:hypothetical protein [Streptomyces europaeiscabiei]MDX3690717.1 hypothetical protein [Streptomyces europaeiscabiei]
MADCLEEPLQCLKDGITYPFEKVGETAAGGAVEAFAKAIGTAASETLQALNGIWMDVKLEDPTKPTADIYGTTSWLVGYVAVASLLIAAIKMALDRRGEPMKQAFMGMWKVLLVGGLAVPAVQALSSASDAYAQDIYTKSSLGDTATKTLGVMYLSSPGLILIFGLLVMLASFVQICLMYIRIGVLIMLVGTLPLAAVSSMTGWGEGWWKKHVGWLAAWLLYKPAAALIIYAATAMTRDTKDLDKTIAGMGMLILSVFALPALLKLIVPATAALGGTSGGTVALNAFNSSVASGAVSSGGTGGGSGGGGGSSQAGGSGPKGSPSTGAGAPAGGVGGAGSAGAGAGGAAGGAAAGAAAGAATGGASVAVQAAAAAARTTVAAASEVANSLDDNDGMKGHNQ